MIVPIVADCGFLQVMALHAVQISLHTIIKKKGRKGGHYNVLCHKQQRVEQLTNPVCIYSRKAKFMRPEIKKRA